MGYTPPMDASDDLRAPLLHRIQGYRASESQVRARAEELAAELEEMEARRQKAEALFEAEFGELPSGPPDMADQGEAGDEPLSPEGPLTGQPWAAAIASVLEESGPLHVRDIWERLQDGGFRTESRDPLRTVVAVAIRSRPRIVRVGANRYALAGRTEDLTEPEGEGGAL